MQKLELYEKLAIRYYVIYNPLGGVKGFRFYDPISEQILRSYAEAEFERSLERQFRIQAEAIAAQERLQKEKLAAYLRSLGINPDEI